MPAVAAADPTFQYGKIGDDTSVRFAFTAHYDQAPAPLKPFSLPFDAGFLPGADKLDTTTEVALIFNFI